MSESPPKILFVCLGNICRSPAAEALVRAALPQAVTDSAGTSDWHVGEAPYEPMQVAARARGIDMSDLRARQFEADDFDRFDLILVMDEKNRTTAEALRPAGNQTPLELFAPLAGTGQDTVPDPYYTRDFDGCLDLLEAATKGLLQQVHSA